MKILLKTVFIITLLASGLFLLQCERADIFKKAHDTSGGTGSTAALDVVISGDNYTDETGKSTTLSVKLSREPLGDVFVTADLITIDQLEASVSPSSFAFSTTGWDSAVTITVTGIDDSVYDKDKSYSVNFSSTSTGDPDFEGLTNSINLTNVSNDRYILLSTTSTNGDFGGISAADTICNSDGIIFDSSLTYRALIVDGVDRIADLSVGQQDWVLIPGGKYYGTDGTLIASTDINSQFTDPLSGILSASSFAWTGFDNAEPWRSSTENCNNWTDNGATAPRGSASSNVLDDFLAGGAVTSCSSAAYLYCVEYR